MARSTQFTEQHLTKLTKYQDDQDADEGSTTTVEDRSQQHHKPPLAQRRFFDSNDNLSSSNGAAAAAGVVPKPDKPPRPVLVSTECQTLNRSQYRSAKETDRANKPFVQPKSMLFVNRSTENLSDKRVDDDYDEPFYDEVPVTLRDKADSDGGGGTGFGEKPAKPAIPERPMSLMRPPSYKTGSNDTTNYQPSSLQQHHVVDQPLKKTQSFRTNATAQIVATPTKMNGGGGGGGNGSLTTLERTHIYNVDKKQVAIIDFVDQTANVASASNSKEKRPPPLDGGSSNSTASNSNTMDSATTMTTSATMMTNVPPSPRGFDSKIKRPGVPAPPPPTNRPKSDGGDSTNL